MSFKAISTKPLHLAAGLAVAGTMLMGSTSASADTVKRSLCIYDPVGANGPIYQSMTDYVTQALNWGVQFELKPYTDEDVAASDFKSGKCDAVGMTGVHNIDFVKFAGSLDMVGGLQTYDEVRKALDTMASPKAAKYMSSGNFEVVAVVPGGKVYLFARNKENLTGLQKAAGKKVAVLSFDKQASTLANVAGASPVPATIATFGPMFNNGSVDYAYSPALAYKPLELYKGLGTNGGVADYVLGMLSAQLDIHKDKFPPDFGQQSRTWVNDNMWDRVMPRIHQADNDIPAQFWYHVDGEKSKDYSSMLVKVRQTLWDNNWYDHTMQHMLKKIRCQANPSVAECTQDSEGGPA